MNYISGYFHAASQALQGLVYVWPVTFCLIFFIVLTAIKYGRKEKLRFSLRYLPILAPLLLIFGTLSIGVFWRFSYAENPGTKPPSRPSTLLIILFWAHLPLAAIIGYKLKEIRWLAVAIVALEIWYALWCSFIASMSVTDDWL